MENSQKILTERKSRAFYKPRGIHSVANAIDGIEASMIILVASFFVGW